jgi:hypothetical protein
MVQHIVMWRFKEENKPETLLQVKALFLNLVGKVPSLRHLEVGENWNGDTAAFDFVLIARFDDRAGLDAYQNHPEHVKVAQFIQSVRTDRAVVDCEI